MAWRPGFLLPPGSDLGSARNTERQAAVMDPKRGRVLTCALEEPVEAGSVVVVCVSVGTEEGRPRIAVRDNQGSPYVEIASDEVAAEHQMARVFYRQNAEPALFLEVTAVVDPPAAWRFLTVMEVVARAQPT